MPTHTTDPTSLIQSEYQDVVRELDALTRQHLIPHRLEVGGVILRRFFGGKPALYHDRDPGKESKFGHFLDQHAEDLAQSGLGETVLRQCVRVRICHDLLPPAVRDRLGWSVLVNLSTLLDPTERARLATAAVNERWTVARCKEVIRQAKQGRVWDTDPEAAGLQLPETEEPGDRDPQPGRLVTRTEKWSEDIATWHQAFARVDPTKLTRQQVARMRAAVQTVRGQLDALEKRLPE